MKIEKEDTCRLCRDEPETIEHQLIECMAMTEKLRNFRVIYEQRSITEFNQSLYDGHSGFMRKFLAKAKKHGCCINITTKFEAGKPAGVLRGVGYMGSIPCSGFVWLSVGNDWLTILPHKASLGPV